MKNTELNYHHLRYFWLVAKEGHLTHVAEQICVSQSALSSQIRQLEEQLGQPLFVREGRRLTLTETGRIAQSYAEEIFTKGGEFLALLQDGRGATQTLKVGAVATLSRNFQESFLQPLLTKSDVQLCLSSGSLDTLLTHLETHALDVVLSNRPCPHNSPQAWRCQRIAQQQVSLVGRPRKDPFRFPHDLPATRMLLPSRESELRTGFDLLCEELGIQVRILAEVDDMAMLRLLVRDTHGVALVPSVVVRDELQSGRLQEYCVVPTLQESFYAITLARSYPHPLLDLLLRPCLLSSDILPEYAPETLS